MLPHEHGHAAETRILEQLPSEQAVKGVADALRQLGDPTRLRIFWILCHCEECVTDLAEMVSMSSPAVSHHLRILKDSGLILSRRDGREVLYRTADTELASVLHHLIENIAEITCPE